MGPDFPARQHFHEGPGTGAWILWILLTIAFWALVITAIIWLVRSVRGRSQPAFGSAQYRSHPFASAEQILAERFAHGQIDESEYRTRLDVLRGGVRPASVPAGRLAPPAATAPPASPEPPTA